MADSLSRCPKPSKALPFRTDEQVVVTSHVRVIAISEHQQSDYRFGFRVHMYSLGLLMREVPPTVPASGGFCGLHCIYFSVAA